jgi:starch-binding outer membrane protein, SusD/RagB family
MKKHLKFFYTILVAALALVVSGCEDYLDKEPLSELSTGTFFKAKGDMTSWVHGTYDALQNALLSSNGSTGTAGALEWGDLRSDNYGHTTYGDTKPYLNAIDASQSQYSWEYLYRIIDRCNVGIIRFPGIPNILPAEYNDFLGQLHGLRALAYFYAIRVWGDVPLTIEPWDGVTVEKANLPRTPVADVKAQILSDIDKALETLSADVANTRKFYFNRAAARALKTDVHMWFKEYDLALAASDYFVGAGAPSTIKLIAPDPVSPPANYTRGYVAWKNMFTDPIGSTETIFTMNWSQDPSLPDGNNAWAQRVGASNTNNTYQISRGVYDEFIRRYRSGNGRDGRLWGVLDTLKLFVAGGSVVPIGFNHYGLNGTAKNTKFSHASTLNNERWVVLHSNTSAVQLPIYRLADVMLLRAEALNKLGRGTEALTIVNDIRGRVGYRADSKTEVNPADQNAVENVILLERQLEFMAEGKRWFDLVRTGKVIEVMDPVLRQRQTDLRADVIGFGDPGRIKFPIYYKEFEANPSLRGFQNPPYTE